MRVGFLLEEGQIISKQIKIDGVRDKRKSHNLVKDANIKQPCEVSA
jgi:hypothetical protein